MLRTADFDSIRYRAYSDLQNLDSGDDIPVTPEFWETLRSKLAARRAKKRSPDVIQVTILPAPEKRC